MPTLPQLLADPSFQQRPLKGRTELLDRYWEGVKSARPDARAQAEVLQNLSKLGHEAGYLANYGPAGPEREFHRANSEAINLLYQRAASTRRDSPEWQKTLTDYGGFLEEQAAEMTKLRAKDERIRESADLALSARNRIENPSLLAIGAGVFNPAQEEERQRDLRAAEQNAKDNILSQIAGDRGTAAEGEEEVHIERARMERGEFVEPFRVGEDGRLFSSAEALLLPKEEAAKAARESGAARSEIEAFEESLGKRRDALADQMLERLDAAKQRGLLKRHEGENDRDRALALLREERENPAGLALTGTLQDFGSSVAPKVFKPRAELTSFIQQFKLNRYDFQLWPEIKEAVAGQLPQVALSAGGAGLFKHTARVIGGAQAGGQSLAALIGAAALPAGVQSANTFRDAREQGFTVTQSSQLALNSFLAEAGPTFLFGRSGVEKLFVPGKGVAKEVIKRNMLHRMARSGLAEIAEEEISTFLDILGTQVALNPEMTPKDAWKAARQALLAAGVLGAAGGVPGGVQADVEPQRRGPIEVPDNTARVLLDDLEQAGAAATRETARKTAAADVAPEIDLDAVATDVVSEDAEIEAQADVVERLATAAELDGLQEALLGRQADSLGDPDADVRAEDVKAMRAEEETREWYARKVEELGIESDLSDRELEVAAQRIEENLKRRARKPRDRQKQEVEEAVSEELGALENEPETNEVVEEVTPSEPEPAPETTEETALAPEAPVPASTPETALDQPPADEQVPVDERQAADPTGRTSAPTERATTPASEPAGTSEEDVRVEPASVEDEGGGPAAARELTQADLNRADALANEIASDDRVRPSVRDAIVDQLQKDPDSSEALLRTVGRRAASRRGVRTAEREARAEGRVGSEEALATEATEGGVVDDVLRREKLDAVTRAMNERLTANERTALEAVVVEGLSSAEAAEQLGITPDAARKRVERARGKLKEAVREAMEADPQEFRLRDPGTSELYAGPGRLPFIHKLPGFDWLARKLRARGRLPEEAFEAQVEGQAEANSLIKEADLNRRKLETLVKQEVKANPARGVAPLTQRQRLFKQVHRVLTGNEDIDALPESLREVTTSMRDHVDRVSEQLVAAGFVNGDAAEIVLSNVGTYLNRSYRRFDDPKKWNREVSDRVKETARRELRRQFPQEPAQSDADYRNEIEGKLMDLLLSGSATPAEALSRSAVGRMNFDNLKRRQDVPKWLRDLWGERTEANEVYLRTIHKMAHQLGTYQFLEDTRNQGLGTFLFEPNPRTGASPDPAFPVQISAEGNRALAPLDGLYTTEEVAAAFNELAKTHSEPWVRLLVMANAYAKFSKTVLSPITHVRNFNSNIFFLTANGNLSGLTKSGLAMRAIASDLLPQTLVEKVPGRRPAEEVRAYLLKLTRLGVVEDAAVAGELRAILEESLNSELDFADFAENRMKRTVRLVGKAATRLYAAEDAFWKILNFEAEAKKYAKAKPGWTRDHVENQAAINTRATMPTYSLIPEGVKDLRRFPFLGNFVSFSSEVIRNNYNLVRLIKSELADPDLRGIGAKRMAGFLFAHSVPWVLTAMLRQFLGIDDEDEDAVRALSAPWDQDSQLLFLPTGGKNPKFINISYTDPFAMFKKVPLAFWNEDNPVVATGKALRAVFEPFISEEIAVSAILDWSRNVTKEGQQVYDPHAPEHVQGRQIAEHFWKAFEPNAIRDARVLKKAAEGNSRYNLATEITARVTGQRIVTLDPAESVKWRSLSFAQNNRDSTQQFSKVARSRDEVSDEALKTAYRNAVRARNGVWRDYQDSLQAARHLGVSEQEIKRTAKAFRAGEKNARAALKGEIPRWAPSDALLKTLSTERRAQVRRVLRELRKED